MREPVKISMVERQQLLRICEGLVGGVRDLWPDTRIIWVGMYPRHVEKCCEEVGHMDEEDVWLMASVRREMDNELRRRLYGKVEFIEWYETLGMEREPGRDELKAFVCEDGVHLASKYNRNAAEMLCYRVVGEEMASLEERPRKALRTESERSWRSRGMEW